MHAMERVLCLIIGYLCGCFLTAEVVARRRTGKGVHHLGSGNPGMANIGAQMGPRWAAAVLAGDVGKTALPCLLCHLFFSAVLGRLAVLWAGVGSVLGHNFPFWRGFRGGKGVATTCACLVFSTPLWGGASCLLGLAVVALAGYLPLGAVVIPAVFLLPAFFLSGPEAGMLGTVLTLVMLSRHVHGLERIVRGEEGRVGPAGRRA